MSKISLIIRREYTTRVMKKSFIILTFLSPLLFAGMITIPLWLSGLKGLSEKHVYVIDRTNQYRQVLKSNESYKFEFIDDQIDNVRTKKTTGDKEFTAVLLIDDDLSKNPKGATIYSQEQIGVDLKNYITGVLNKYVEQKKLEEYNIPEINQMIEKSHSDIKISSIKWDKNGKEVASSAELALVIGMISAFIIYMFIVIYGAQVMSGVIQEKTSRIVEVIISSVKPYELMMGKIIGIALVGLTQFFMWIALTAILSVSVGAILGPHIDVNSLHQNASQMNIGMPGIESTTTESSVSYIFNMLDGLNLVKTLLFFLVYFLGGYLLYASLFAAVGSAVDNETDTQQFSFPLTLPIIFAIYAALYSVQNPHGPLAMWCSMIPFTSPVVMMVRLPYGVPTWQIVLSLSILAASFIGTTWMAAKIYRTGILMYGKKVTWKELWKWLNY
ncbi:MAG: ABC transporter permease [Paludibacter sp.]